MKPTFLLILLLNACIIFSQEGVPIKKNKQFYLYGNTAVIGNNVVSNHETKPFNNRDVVNDEVKMKYVDIDKDETTFSSSQATLILPENSNKIVYAALYWSAIYRYDIGTLKTVGNSNKYAGDDTNRNYNVNKIKLKMPSSAYQTITGNIIYDDFHSKTFPNNTPYACYADITDLLNKSKQVNGDYTVANITATQGYVSGGCSGGWLLYVVYEAPTDHPIYVTTYDGFIQVNKQNPSMIEFKDFKTQEVGFVKTNITIATLEGDEKLNTDQILIMNPTNNSFVALGNSLRTEKNIFNSSITYNELELDNRNPFSKNTLGFDLLQMQLPNPNNELISNNVNQITMKIKTRKDRFYLFFTALQTDISEVNYKKNKGKDSEISSIDNDITKENNNFTADTLTQSEIIKIKTDTEIKEPAIAIVKSPEAITGPDQENISRVLQSPSIDIEGIASGYYLVTNVFSDHSNTLRWVSLLENKGYTPKIFTNPNNLWEYVYIYYDENINTTYDRYKETFELPYFKDIWIFRINLD